MIAGNKGNRQWAGDNFLLKDLQRVIAAHTDEAELQKQLADAVMHIVAHEPSNKAQAAAIEIVKDLQVVFRAHNNVDTLVAVCHAISHVCHECFETKQQALAIGLLDDVQYLMNFADDAQLLHAATFAHQHMLLYKRTPQKDEVSVDLGSFVDKDFAASPSSATLQSPSLGRKKFSAAAQTISAAVKFQLAMSPRNPPPNISPGSKTET